MGWFQPVDLTTNLKVNKVDAGAQWIWSLSSEVSRNPITIKPTSPEILCMLTIQGKPCKVYSGNIAWQNGDLHKSVKQPSVIAPRTVPEWQTASVSKAWDRCPSSWTTGHAKEGNLGNAKNRLYLRFLQNAMSAAVMSFSYRQTDLKESTCWCLIFSQCKHEAEMTWGDRSSHWGCISGQDHGEWGDFGQPWQIQHEPRRIEIYGLRSEHAVLPCNGQSLENLAENVVITLKIWWYYGEYMVILYGYGDRLWQEMSSTSRNLMTLRQVHHRCWGIGDQKAGTSKQTPRIPRN